MYLIHHGSKPAQKQLNNNSHMRNDLRKAFLKARILRAEFKSVAPMQGKDVVPPFKHDLRVYIFHQT
jgi:hypothetical protein